MAGTTAIVTDSTADLSPRQQSDLGITVVPLNVHFGQESWQDRVDLSADEFLAKLSASDKLPTTSQPSVGVFEQVFRTLAETHDAIICPVISSRLSGTFQSAHLASQAVADVVRVFVIDSDQVSAALGMQARHAARLAHEGRPATEIAETLRTETDLYHTAFFVETLDHLRRGGRIGKAAQVLGTALQLKPMLRIEEGQIVPYERTRTRVRATAALIDFVRDCGPVQEAAVVYNTTPEDAAALAIDIATLMHVEAVPIVQLGPVVSTHVGPGILGVVIKEESHG